MTNINKPKYEDPYFIEYKNTSNESKNCFLLGYNEFSKHENWGNDSGVSIESLVSGKHGYTMMMNELFVGKKDIVKWVFTSDDKRNVQQIITFMSKVSTGYTEARSSFLLLSECEKEGNDFRVELKRRLTTTPESQVNFTLLPNTKMTIIMYPRSENYTEPDVEETKSIYTDPYAIKITNKADSMKSCQLFGYTQNFSLKNYGNSIDLEINNVFNPNGGYSQLLVQSFTKPNIFGKFVLHSKNLENVSQNIKFTHTTAQGDFNKTVSENVFGIKDFEYKQEQDDHFSTLEIGGYAGVNGAEGLIDHATIIDLIMQPNSELIIVMYPLIYQSASDINKDPVKVFQINGNDPVTIIHTSPEIEKTLDNTSIEDAKKKVSDIKVFGNGDLFQLIAKASSESQGWMKSTKAMQCGNDVVIQVTTQQKNPDGSYAVAEALTTVNMALIDVDANGNKCVVARYPAEPFVVPSFESKSESSIQKYKFKEDFHFDNDVYHVRDLGAEVYQAHFKKDQIVDAYISNDVIEGYMSVKHEGHDLLISGDILELVE